MSFPVPSMSELRTQVVALGRALLPDQDWSSSRTYYGKMATFVSGVASSLHAHVSSVATDLHPLTAPEGKPINDWCQVFGTSAKGATSSRRAAAGRVQGLAGTSIAPGLQMVHVTSGQVFQVANVVAATIPGVAGVDPDGYVDVDISSVDVGSKTRLSAGETLQLLVPPLGILGVVTLQLDLDEGGLDVQQFGQLRTAMLTKTSTESSGGNEGDFARWATEAIPNVGVAYAFPNRGGRGTIDVAAFAAGKGSARSLSVDERAAVLAYLRKKSPFQVAGEGGGLRVLATVPDPQIVEVLVTAQRGSEFQWGGVGEVLTYNSATRELRFAAPLPSALRAGHSLILQGVASGSGVLAQDGRSYRVESIAGTDKVILQSAPQTAPAATDLIFPGGPLVNPIRDAIAGHLNGEVVYFGRGQIPLAESSAFPQDPLGQRLGNLDVLCLGAGPSNRNGKYGDWYGGINRSTLTSIAGAKAGVGNVSVLSPTVDYEIPEDLRPNDGQVRFAIPAVVIVRSL